MPRKIVQIDRNQNQNLKAKRLPKITFNYLISPFKVNVQKVVERVNRCDKAKLEKKQL